MVTAEEQFAAELARDYRRQGWDIKNPQEACAVIGFQPDLLLNRGENYLVVEIKRAGGSTGASVADLRKKVEQLPNWKLELKLLPPDKEYIAIDIADSETPARLALIRQLVSAGRYSDAAIFAWIVIESSLRRLSPVPQDTNRLTPIPELLRTAYEEEKISDAELRLLQRIAALRDQIVHGYRVDLSKADADEVAALAETLAERVPPSPAA